MHSKIEKTFSAYARAITKKLGMKFYFGANTYTDGKKIVIRQLPINLKKDDYNIALGGLLHECGHVLYSNFIVLRTNLDLVQRKRLHTLNWFSGSTAQSFRFSNYVDVLHGTWNAIEDHYMELRVESFFSGAKNIFLKGSLAMFRKGNVRKPNQLSDCIGLLAYFEISTLRGRDVQARADEVDNKLLEIFGDDVLPVIAEVKKMVREEFPGLNSTEDTFRVAVNVLLKFDQFFEDQKSDDETEENSDDTDENSESEVDSDDEPEDKKDDKQESEENSDDTDENSVSEVDSDDDSNESDDSAVTDGDSKEKPEDVDQKSLLSGEASKEEIVDYTNSLDELVNAINSGDNPNYERSDLAPLTDPKKMTDDEQRKMIDQSNDTGYIFSIVSGINVAESDISEYRKISRNLSPIGVKFKKELIESKSSGCSGNTMPSRRGRIKASKLSRVPAGELKVFKKKLHNPTPKSNSTVSILFDLSYSMTDSMDTGNSIFSVAQEILVCLEQTMEKYKLPNAIYGFGDKDSHALTRIKGFNESHNKAKARIGGLSQHLGGGTPLHTALYIAGDELCEQSKLKKTIFLITDGYPQDSEACRKTVLQNDDLGIQTVIVAINSHKLSWLDGTDAKVSYVSSSQELATAFLEHSDRL
jgi:hypothetical protein